MNQHTDSDTPVALDLKGVLEVASGDKAFLQELLTLYIRQFSETPAELRASMQKGDRLQLRRIFHRLRPSVLMLKNEEMIQLGEHIHQQLHNEEVGLALLQPQLDKYIYLMERSKTQLQQEAEKVLAGS